MASKPKVNQITMAQETVAFDADAFDMVLRSNGVIMTHWASIKCPLGIDDRFDVRQHGDHSDCSNGFLYKKVGDITVFFSGNTSSSHLEDMGVVDGSTTNITLPRYYDNSDKEVAIQHYDRFFLKELATFSVNTQLIEAHVTGQDRLQYPAVAIDFVIDSNGVEYNPDDYETKEGSIHWKTARRPGYDAKLSKGVIFSIRYRYTPFWYVKNIVHEVRVARSYNHQTQTDDLIRLPYAVQLQREYMFENEERSSKGQSDGRDVKTPRKGSYGPR